jgi:peptidoglycan/xylan/chitin deacetylase (PgdA/CDA1 family)
MDFNSVPIGALLAAALLLSPSPLPAGQPQASFERGRRDLPKLALTFDGGGAAGETVQILETLRERGVRATFFLTGEYVRRNPGLVLAIVADGHEVGNHTWTHPHLTTWDRTHRHDTLPGVDRALLERQLGDTARAFAALTGEPMAPLWRAPYGEVNRELLAWAAAAGWGHVGWSRDDAGGRETLDSLDWVSDTGSRNYLSSAQISARIRGYDAGGARLNGGVVLMHLASRSVDPGSARLGALVDQLRLDGYQLVAVSELRRDAAMGTDLFAARR